MANRQWREQLRHEAEEKLAIGLRMSGESWQSLSELADRVQIGEGHDYEYEAALWQMWKDASGESTKKEQERAEASAYLLDAGKRFTEVSDFDRALICLLASYQIAKHTGGQVYRDIQIRAAHTIAYTFLTILERERDESARAVASELAARYQELEGYLELKYGDSETAARCYGSAGFRYVGAEKFTKAARAYDREAEIWLKRGDFVAAGSAFELKADSLFQGAQVTPDLKSDGIAALLAAGRTLAKAEPKRLDGARLIQRAAELMIEEQAVGRSHTPDGELAEAAAIFERIGEHKEADESHYLRNRQRRLRDASGRFGRSNPAFLLSVLLDLAWGYGTRPLRLIPTAAVVIVSFALIYAVTGVAWIGTGERTMPGAISIASAALLVSVTSFLPVEVIARLGKLHVLPQIQLGAFGEVCVLVESLVGLAVIAMAAYSAKQWVTRRFLPKEPH